MPTSRLVRDAAVSPAEDAIDLVRDFRVDRNETRAGTELRAVAAGGVVGEEFAAIGSSRGSLTVFLACLKLHVRRLLYQAVSWADHLARNKELGSGLEDVESVRLLNLFESFVRNRRSPLPRLVWCAVAWVQRMLVQFRSNTADEELVGAC